MRRITTASAALTALAVPLLGVLATPSPSLAAGSTGVPDGEFAKLHSVSASSSTDAWAVGFRSPPGSPHTLGLTRHWDGVEWTTVPSVHPSENSFLWGVADISPTDAWAVGEWIGGATIQAFAEHWDGMEWTEVALRNPPGLGKLNAVSAIGPDDVWMTGTGYPGPTQTARTFFMHWNGATLHRVRPAHLLHNRATELSSISAVGAGDVWAVGGRGKHGDTASRPLIEHYDGTSWSIVPGATDAASSAALGGVSALSDDDAWAVGWQAGDGEPVAAAFAEHWDGTEWTQIPALSPGYSTFLTNVNMVAADDVWAVGNWVKSEQDRTIRPLIEHWDGETWSIVHAPSGGPGSSGSIESVSMTSASDGLAVGESTTDQQTVGYKAHWDGESWSR